MQHLERSIRISKFLEMLTRMFDARVFTYILNFKLGFRGRIIYVTVVPWFLCCRIQVGLVTFLAGNGRHTCRGCHVVARCNPIKGAGLTNFKNHSAKFGKNKIVYTYNAYSNIKHLCRLFFFRYDP